MYAMKIYIEFFVADNIVVTALTASLSYAFTGLRTRRMRAAAVAVAGTLAGVFYPFWIMPTPLIVLSKAALGIAFSVILFCGIRNPLFGALCFFASTALLGGVTLMAECLLWGDIGLALSSPSRLPYFVPSATSLLVYIPARFVIAAARKKRAESAFGCTALVTVDGCSARLRGYFDTGSGLEEKGIPVVIIKLSSFVGSFGTGALTKRTGVKTVCGVGGACSRLILIKPDGFLLYFDKIRNKYSDVMLGVSAAGFRREEDMLLPVSMLGGANA